MATNRREGTSLEIGGVDAIMENMVSEMVGSLGPASTSFLKRKDNALSIMQ